MSYYFICFRIAIRVKDEKNINRSFNYLCLAVYWGFSGNPFEENIL
jgi:hypothetical protein